MKTCTKCGETKPLDMFNRNTRNSDGRRYECRSCQSAQHKLVANRINTRNRRAYHKDPEKHRAEKRKSQQKHKHRVNAERKQAYHADPEKYRAQKRNWAAKNKELLAECNRKDYLKHRETRRAAQRAYRAANAEHIRKKSREWSKNNPEKRRMSHANRKKKVLAATPSWSGTETELAGKLLVYTTCQMKTTRTGRAHHGDHIIPLTHHLVCGLHCADNLQVKRGINNLKKSNKFDQEYESENQLHITLAKLAA